MFSSTDDISGNECASQIDGVFLAKAKNYEEFKKLVMQAYDGKADPTEQIRNIAIEVRSFYYYIRCIELLQKYKRTPRPLIFRGHDDAQYSLAPSIMRESIFPVTQTRNQVDDYEAKLMAEFRKHVRPLLRQLPDRDDARWEWLALAQHHFLPTRLLDWTYRAGTALFFAIEKQIGHCSCVWAILAPDEVDVKEHKDPAKIDKVYLYNPPHISPRITMQQGCFTVHPSNYKVDPMHWINGLRVIFYIKENSKLEVLSGLAAVGVNRASLFPDLDGIACHLRDTIKPLSP